MQSISDRLSERKKRQKIDERKCPDNPTHTYCKRSRPLPCSILLSKLVRLPCTESLHSTNVPPDLFDLHFAYQNLPLCSSLPVVYSCLNMFRRCAVAELLSCFPLCCDFIGGGRVVRWRWVNFQCRGVLLILILVGQGPTALTTGAAGGCLGIFALFCSFSFLSPSPWETDRYRLKYCLKGPLSPKQPTNQCNFIVFISSFGS